jgi:glycosyltransferase involved in cell wall biosynthesis
VNILFLVSSQGHYGIESMMITLARGLRLSGCRCIVAAFRDSRSPHIEVVKAALDAGLEVEIIPCAGKFDWNVVRHLRNLIIRYRLDVMHPHGYKADFYAFAAAWRNRVALLATSHNWPSRRAHMRFYASLDRLVLRYFDRVVVVSDAVAKKLKRSGVSAQKLFTIYNGVDLERFEKAVPAFHLQDRGPIIGFVGRLVPDKGGAILLQAARPVLRSYPAVTLVFVGDGPCRAEWGELAKRLGIERQVLFIGAREDMPETYAALDIFVLPSLVESMPMCVLEAMAAGKAVIATRVGMIPDVIVDGANGLLVDSANIPDLSDAILALLGNPFLRRQLAKSAQECIAQRFSAEAMVRNYLTHYRQVLANFRETPLESVA